MGEKPRDTEFHSEEYKAMSDKKGEPVVEHGIRKLFGRNKQEQPKGGPHVEEAIKLLDNQKFVEFLDGFEGDEIYPSTPEGLTKLEQRFEQFELSKKAGPEMKKFFKERIKADIDINLSDAEMAEVDTFIQEAAREDPESIKEMMKNLELVAKQEALIGEKEAELEAMVEQKGGLYRIEQRAKRLEMAKKTGKQRNRLFGRFAPVSEDQASAREYLKEEGVDEKMIDSQYETTQKSLKIAKDLEALHEARETLFNDVGPAKEIFAKARAKAQEKLRGLMNPTKDIKEWEEALRYAERLKQKSDKAPIDYTEGLTVEVPDGDETVPLEGKYVEEWLQVHIEDRVNEIIRNALRDHSTFGKFEAKVNAVVNRETLGGKSGAEKKEFIRQVLTDQQAGASPAKRIFLRTFLASFDRETK